jgi:hypothetical protein
MRLRDAFLGLGESLRLRETSDIELRRWCWLVSVRIAGLIGVFAGADEAARVLRSDVLDENNNDGVDDDEAVAGRCWLKMSRSIRYDGSHGRNDVDPSGNTNNSCWLQLNAAAPPLKPVLPVDVLDDDDAAAAAAGTEPPLLFKFAAPPTCAASVSQSINFFGSAAEAAEILSAGAGSCESVALLNRRRGVESVCSCNAAVRGDIATAVPVAPVA